MSLTAVLWLAACSAAADPAAAPVPTLAEPQTIPTETAAIPETAEAEDTQADPTAEPTTDSGPANSESPAATEVPVSAETAAPPGMLYRAGEEGFFAIDAAGQPELLTLETDYLLSPTGEQAIYLDGQNLMLANLAEDTIAQLTADIIVSSFYRWVDTDTIVAGIWLDPAAEEGANLAHPALIDAATGDVVLIDETRLLNSFPALGPDGAVAYATVQISADDTNTTWLYRPESGSMPFTAESFAGNSLAQQPFATLSSPAFSPDGRFLAWLVSDGQQMNVALFDLAAQTVVDFESFPAAPFGGPVPAPVFSPDGKWIALHRLTDRPETAGLVLYDSVNGNSVFVAQNGGRPAWLNNEVVLFTAYDANFNGSVQQYNVATGERLAIPLPTPAELMGIRPSAGN